MNKDAINNCNEITFKGKLNTELIEISGSIEINSKLVSFLYELLRDHLPASTVQQILSNSQIPEVTYSNGFLAQYAQYVANNLK